MKLKPIVSTLLAAVIAVGVAAQSQAQEKGKDKPKEGEKAEKKKTDAYPFNGKIASVDKTAKTVTLQGKEKARVIQITPDTRITKLGKPATLDDATAGEIVGGQVRRTAEGKEAAVSLRIGPAPEGKAKEGGDKGKSEEKGKGKDKK
jgi:hypothetical protein